MASHMPKMSTVRHSDPLPEAPVPLAPQPDFTYIDWMKEAAAPPAARKWAVLALTALLVGYATVLINVASAGLNDLKMGLCLSKLDNWSLLSPYLTCPAGDWYDWLALLVGRSGFWPSALVTFPLYLLFVCVFVGAAGYIKHTWAPLVKQSGIPEMKLIVAGFNYHLDAYLGAPTFLAKTAALVLVVGSGLWLGKEGPLVHIACCLLTVCLSHVSGAGVADGRRRELLTAATATGIAVAFDLPVGGVLFVAELLPSYFIPTKVMWHSFVCSTVALIALTGSKVFTDGSGFHEQALFHVLFGNFSWLFAESVPFVLLGAAGGLYGHAFTSVYMAFSSPHYKLRLWKWLAATCRVAESRAHYIELLALAAVSALLTFVLPVTRMPLGSLLKQLYTACPESGAADPTFFCLASAALLPTATMFQLIYIIALGFLLSTYSYSVALPGGVLMPSLVLGAATGRLVGLVSQAVQNSIGAELWATCTAKSCTVSPSLYAVVGSAAFLTGITKLSLSVVVIMFELTGAVTYVLPIMVAVMVAKFVNDWLCEANIYDAWLENEFNLSRFDPLAELNAGKGNGLCEFSTKPANFKSRMPNVSVAAAMAPLSRTRHLVVFPSSPYSLSELYAYMSDDAHEGYPLVATEASPVALGYVTKSELYMLLQKYFGNLQLSAELFVFRVDVPGSVKHEQSQYELRLAESGATIHIIPVTAQTPTVIAKANAPLAQIVDLFEIMHLNYLVLMDPSNNRFAAGFVDRFMIARILNQKFANIPHDSFADAFHIDDDDNDYTPQRRYNSVNLIS